VCLRTMSDGCIVLQVGMCVRTMSDGRNVLQVMHVCVSADSEWVLSASADNVLKCWSAGDGREIFAVRLNMVVSSMLFDSASLHAAVLGQCTDGSTKVAIFKLVGC
jgi:WD40 repeat protein